MGNPYSVLGGVSVPAYQPDDGSAMAGAIDKISGAYRQRKAREEEQRRWELERARLLGKDAEYTRQNDINEQREAAKEARDVRDFEVKQDDREAGQVKEVYGMLQGGRPDEAVATAAAREYVDPTTGQRRSIKVDKGAEGGGEDYSGFLSTLPMWGKNGAETMPEEPGGGFASMIMGRKPSVTTPGGKRIEIDPAEGERALDQKAEEQAQRAMDAAMRETDPRMRAAFLREAEIARSRMSGAGGQGVRNVATQGAAQDFQGEQGDKNRGLRALLKGRGASAPAGMDARTVLDADGKPVGLAPGDFKHSTEGVKSREMYSNWQPIKESLSGLRGLVGQSDNWDRVPVIGQHTDTQQQIKGIVDTILGPTTQILGAGTPQEAEAKRKIATMSVSATQDKATALKNIDAFEKFMADAYNARVRSLVPGAEPAPPASRGGVRPSANPAAGPKDGDTKVIEGQTFTFKNGRWQ